MPAGRPSSYTPELADQICAEVADGSNLTRICARDGMPDRHTVFAWLAKQPDFASKYTRARELRGDARNDRIDQVVQDMRDKKVEWAVGRIEIDALKWQAGREAPKLYGDRLELAGDKDAPLIPPKVIVEFVRPPVGSAARRIHGPKEDA